MIQTEINNRQKRLDEWNAFMINLSGTDLEKVEKVHQFFSQWEYVSDSVLWDAADYWATPKEFIQCGAGDCEDFAVVKYFSLTKSGMSKSKLRIIYAKLASGENHVVLGYYSAPEADPLILDNMIPEILPLSRREDLDVVFSFNEDSVWIHGNQYAGHGNRIVPWNKLMRRIENEC